MTEIFNPKKVKNHTLHLYLDSDVYFDFIKLQKKSKLTKSDLVSKILKEYMEKEREE